MHIIGQLIGASLFVGFVVGGAYLIYGLVCWVDNQATKRRDRRF